MYRADTLTVVPLEPRDGSGTSLIEIIAEAARSDVSAEKVDRLFAAYERIKANEARMAFAAALVAVKCDMPEVRADKRNPQTNSMYVSQRALADAVDPVLIAHGFAVSFTTDASAQRDSVKVIMLLSHAAGHTETYQADIPLDDAGIRGTANKTRTHAYASSISYGRRYLKLMALDISASE